MVSHVSHPMFRLCVCIRKYSSHSTNRPKLGNFHGRTLIFPIFLTLLEREREREEVIRMMSSYTRNHRHHPSSGPQHQPKSTWRFYHQLFCPTFSRFPHNRPYVSPLTVYNKSTLLISLVGLCFTSCFFSIMIFNERAFCVIPHYRPYVSPLTTYKVFLSFGIRANHFWAEMHGCFGFIDKVHVFPHYGPYVSPCVVYNKNQPNFTLVVFCSGLGYFLRDFPLYRIHASVI